MPNEIRAVELEIEGRRLRFVADDDEADAPTAAQQKRLLALCTQVGLDREERIAVAEALLRRDVQTYRGLSRREVERLCDALEGWHLVEELLRQRAID